MNINEYDAFLFKSTHLIYEHIFFIHAHLFNLINEYHTNDSQIIYRRFYLFVVVYI